MSKLKKKLALITNSEYIYLHYKKSLDAELYKLIIFDDKDDLSKIDLKSEKTDLFLIDEKYDSVNIEKIIIKKLKKNNIPYICIIDPQNRNYILENNNSFGFLEADSGVKLINSVVRQALYLHKYTSDLSQKEEELRKSEANLYLTLHSIGDGVISTDSKGRVEQMNPIAEKLCGWTIEEAKGKPLTEIFNIISSVTREKAENPVSKVLENGNIVGLANHTALISRDGTEYQIADSAAPIKDKNGIISGVVMVFTDVTEEYALRMKVQENERKYRSIVDFYPNGIIVLYNKKLEYILVEGRGLEASGLSKEMLLGKKIKDVFPDYFYKEIKKHIESAFKGNKETFEISWNNMHFVQTVVPFKNDGKITEVMGVVENITERKQADEILKSAGDRAKKQRTAIAELALDKDIANGKIENALQVITEIAAKTLNVERASVWLLSEDGRELQCLCLYNAKSNNYEHGAVLNASNYPRYFEAIKKESRINANNARTDKRTSEFTEQYLIPNNIMSMLDAGISLEGQLLGVICIENTKHFKEWTVDEEAFASTVASMVAQVFSNAKKSKIESELKIAKEKAEQSDRLKTSFLQNISHEIRTPLNGIMGFAELLADFDILNDKEKENYLKLINYSSERLLAVVTDIIEMSKIDSGVSKVNKTTFAVSEIYFFTKALIARKIADKNIKYNFVVDKKLENICLYTDKDKLYQIILNLLNNAVKFTEKGSIDLIIEKEKGGLNIIVKDTGVGINQKYHKKIFERFWQSEAMLKNRHGGTGLGLSISKGVADLLGFKISLKSSEGKGSEFTVFIPEYNIKDSQFEKSKKHTKASSRITDSKSNENIKVLIVEDDEINYSYLFHILKKENIQSSWAVNGAVAIDMVKETKYDIVLMDLKMPVLDGFEATKLIKSISPETIVIAQSAYSQSEEKQKAINLGCDAYINKPIKKSKLINIINQYI